MDLKISYSRGGRKEFEETGVFPEYVTFSSKKYNGSWQCQYNSIPQQGSLFIDGKKIFNYIFSGSYFKIQEVNENGKLTDWVEIKIGKVFCD